MSEPLYTCPICRQSGFTARGLKTHVDGKTCRRRAAEQAAGPHWQCRMCSYGPCFATGSKPSECARPKPLVAIWQPATPEEHAAAQTA